MTDNGEKAAVELDVMVTGKVETPRAYVFRGGGNALTRTAKVLRAGLLPGGDMVPFPCLAYVVRHPAAGTILIDTGMHPDASEDLRKDFGLPMSILFRKLKSAATPYVEQLQELGVDAGKVERVLMTHLHVDHTSGMRLLPRASFLVTRKEWGAAQQPRADAKGFVAHHFPSEARIEQVDFDADSEPHGAFSRTINLLGDGSIRLISTPGHTVGHLSVLLRLKGGRQVLIVGDAAYTLQSIREQLPPLLTASEQKYINTLQELRAFTEQEPEAIIVPSHDPTAWHQLRTVTASAEDALVAAAG